MRIGCLDVWFFLEVVLPGQFGLFCRYFNCVNNHHTTVILHIFVVNFYGCLKKIIANEWPIYIRGANTICTNVGGYNTDT